MWEILKLIFEVLSVIVNAIADCGLGFLGINVFFSTVALWIKEVKKK